MATLDAGSGRDGLAELQVWYLSGLQPKLVRAANAGTVDPMAAVALDRQLRELLELCGGGREEAA